MIALCANVECAQWISACQQEALSPFEIGNTIPCDISAFVVISGAFWSGEMRGHSMTETLNMSPTLSFVLHYCHTNHANTAQGLNVKYFPIYYLQFCTGLQKCRVQVKCV